MDRVEELRLVQQWGAGLDGVNVTAPSLARVRPTTYLVNAGRGGLVDEDALLAAPNDDLLASAGSTCSPHRTWRASPMAPTEQPPGAWQT